MAASDDRPRRHRQRLARYRAAGAGRARPAPARRRTARRCPGPPTPSVGGCAAPWSARTSATPAPGTPGRAAGTAFDRVEFAAAGVDDPVDLLPDARRGAPGRAGFAAELAQRRRQPGRRHRPAGPPAPAPADTRARRPPTRTTSAVAAGTARRRRAQPAPLRADPARLGRRRRAGPRPGGRRHPRSGSSPSATTRTSATTSGGARRRVPRAARRAARLPAAARARLAARHRPARPVRGTAARRHPADPRRRAATPCPTAALRTLLLPPTADGQRRYLKVSLDIQVTSTRRSISVASTRNGPAVSALLHRLVADDPDGHRLLLLAETAGAAVPAGSGRDLSAILRDRPEPAPRCDRPGERAVPGGALPAVDPVTGRTVLAGLVTAYARTTGRRDDAAAAGAFLDEYARLLLPPLLRLTTRHGVALEAHLQNCLPTFVDGRAAPAGRARLRRAAPAPAAARRRRAARCRCGRARSSAPTTTQVLPREDRLHRVAGAPRRARHPAGRVPRPRRGRRLAHRAGRRRRDLRPADADPAVRPPRADHAALTAPTVPHKALVRMRLGGTGDTLPAGAEPAACARLSRRLPPSVARRCARSRPGLRLRLRHRGR